MTTAIDYKLIFKENETPEAIMKTSTFQITSRAIAKALHVPLQDAQAMLIEEIHSHRHTLNEITGELTPKQIKAIIFAKRDILTKHFKEQEARQAIETPAVDDKGNNLVNNMTGLPNTGRYSEDELIRVLDVSDELFNARTKEFATNLLLHGKEWTKAEMGLDERVFNKKLKRIIGSFDDPASYSRKKANRLVKSDYQIRNQENVKMAKQFLKLVEEDAPNIWIVSWLQQSIENTYFDPCWDKVKYQGVLLREGFSTPAGRQEAYKFLNTLNEMIAREENK